MNGRMQAEKKAAEDARREAERKAKEESERKAKEEADRKAKAEAEKKAKEDAEKAAFLAVCFLLFVYYFTAALVACFIALITGGDEAAADGAREQGTRPRCVDIIVRCDCFIPLNG